MTAIWNLYVKRSSYVQCLCGLCVELFTYNSLTDSLAAYMWTRDSKQYMVSMLVFWVQSWIWGQYIYPKHRYLSTCLHDIKSHKTNIDIFTAVITTNLKKMIKCDLFEVKRNWFETVNQTWSEKCRPFTNYNTYM